MYVIVLLEERDAKEEEKIRAFTIAEDAQTPGSIPRAATRETLCCRRSEKWVFLWDKNKNTH